MSPFSGHLPQKTHLLPEVSPFQGHLPHFSTPASYYPARRVPLPASRARRSGSLRSAAARKAATLDRCTQEPYSTAVWVDTYTPNWPFSAEIAGRCTTKSPFYAFLLDTYGGGGISQKPRDRAGPLMRTSLRFNCQAGRVRERWRVDLLPANGFFRMPGALEALFAPAPAAARRNRQSAKTISSRSQEAWPTCSTTKRR